MDFLYLCAMAKGILSLLLSIFCALSLSAQSATIMHEEIERMGDEVQIDSMLLAKDIFSILPDNVYVSQSDAIRRALNEHILKNESEQFNGFRVRIFLDSKMGSREASLAAIRRFNAIYPDVMAFRSYSAPNFKVTVGNFRTKLEAERFLIQIRSTFPEAFVVRDKFKYPSIARPVERNYNEFEIEL